MLPLRARLVGPALYVTLLLVAVCAAAVVAHVLIDVVGDYALRHDTYDDVAHSSRLGLLVAALGLAGTLGIGLLWSAFDSARRSQLRLPPLVASPWMFCVAVVGLSILAVAGMETLDGALAGVPADSLADVMGGSVLLGLGLSVPVAILAALGALRFARFIERARSLLVGIITVLVRLIQGGRHPAECRPARAAFAYHHFLAVYLGRAHKRGPPAFA